MAVSTSAACGPNASTEISVPGAAASIIRPMIEVPPTVSPQRVTRTSASKRSTVCTNLAEARACRPFWLMIGLVLVTHGRLAVEFRAALEHVVGPQSQIETVTIGPNDDGEQCRKDIIEAVKRVDTGQGVAILTDMFGGTPSNLAISVMSRPNVEVLAGINLPMLVKLAKVREEVPLSEAVMAAQESGRKYITIASRVLAGK